MSAATCTAQIRVASISERVSGGLRESDGVTQSPAKAAYGAPQDIVLQHQSVALALAARYRGRGIDIEDLQQAAYLGLVKAANRWDPAINDQFVPFAVPSILGEIRHYFRDQLNIIRLPRSFQELHALTAEFESRVSQQRGRTCSIEELAAAAGVSVSRIHDLRRALAHCATASLDDPAVRGSAERSPSAAAAQAVEESENRIALAAMVATLTAQERLLIGLRYYRNMKQQDIAEILGVSQMQVSRLLRRLDQKLSCLSNVDLDSPGTAFICRGEADQRSRKSAT